MAVIKRTDRGVEILVAEAAGPRRLRVLRASDGVWIRSSEGGIVLPPEAIDAVVDVLRPPRRRHGGLLRRLGF